MRSLNLVGISGKKRAGKDFIAGVLTEYGFVRVSMADPLKALAREFFFMNLPDNTSDKPPADRWLLQQLGTEHGRDFWTELTTRFPEVTARLSENYSCPRDFWLMHFEKKLRELQEAQVCGVTAADLRFPNEADYFKRNGGILIRVARPGTVDKCDPSAQHSSETALDAYPDFDYVIENDGDSDDLRRTVCYLYDDGLRPRSEPLHLSALAFSSSPCSPFTKDASPCLLPPKPSHGTAAQTP